MFRTLGRLIGLGPPLQLSLELEPKRPVRERREGRRVERTHPADERFLLSVSGKTAHLWNVSERRELFALSHQEQIRSARFNAKGDKIITASDDGTARIWSSGS